MLFKHSVNIYYISDGHLDLAMEVARHNTVLMNDAGNVLKYEYDSCLFVSITHFI